MSRWEHLCRQAMKDNSFYKNTKLYKGLEAIPLSTYEELEKENASLKEQNIKEAEQFISEVEKIKEEISYTRTLFSSITFFDENDNELMQLTDTYSAKDYAMRVPCIGERVILSSYKNDHISDEEAIFRTFYKVIDVITHYSENKAYKNISVQYSVILRKE